MVSFVISMYACSEILFESKDKIIGNDVFCSRNLDKLKHCNDVAMHLCMKDMRV